MSQMEYDQHPEELSQVDNTPRPLAASPIVVAPTSASENAGQKRKIADLEENLTSGHTLKRQMITLLDNIEDLVGKNGCDKDDDDIHVTLVFSQDRLRIGYVALKTSSDSDSMEHDNHLHMSKRLKQRVYDLRGDVNGDQTIANTLMTQAQLRDSQRRINTLHTELFDLRGRLYDAQVEHARDLAEIQREMLQMRESSGRNHKKLPSSPPKGNEEFERMMNCLRKKAHVLQRLLVGRRHADWQPDDACLYLAVGLCVVFKKSRMPVPTLMTQKSLSALCTTVRMALQRSEGELPPSLLFITLE
ncbi:uncharacterized protein HD556DRAFT_1450929 [Suillus plorans]|uniref:Uncharacterized protein n=1 Tax=Suillus plorans TaxID=116603 RepID=A0A9P7ABU0_9AGAM|nr:uncharacterized protein HD556DRAFT_1450929 [Suillus plorans]KAG1785255.1 hypothetical protein HD556DRAFT_1450929 [Suillus plorans]